MRAGLLHSDLLKRRFGFRLNYGVYLNCDLLALSFRFRSSLRFALRLGVSILGRPRWTDLLYLNQLRKPVFVQFVRVHFFEVDHGRVVALNK